MLERAQLELRVGHMYNVNNWRHDEVGGAANTTQSVNSILTGVAEVFF